ncbi:MAG: HD domain-containing protein [Bacteroidales bacterium]|nr:HD domain-containing protein [Bacteroidales bacterium]
MELLLEKINSSEQKWLKPLYKHSKSLFQNTHLPSHDAEHHLRVWLHCRGLFIELHKAGIKTTHDSIDKAIVACFFHDAGLTLNVGEQHGFLGRKICEDFFKNNHNFQVPDLSEVLDVIEKHDDKSKKEISAVTPYTMKTILRLVSAADDLDALGYIGVFRYIEIYLKRGIPDSEIPKKVTTNLKNRFSNFLSTYSGLPKFSERQKIRYKETFDFFTELDGYFSQKTEIPDSQLTVFKILKESLVEKRLGIDETIEETLRINTKGYPLWYFSKLRNELEVTSALLLD